MSGVVAGAAAFVLGLFVTFVTAGIAATRLPGLGPFGQSVPEWKATIWVYFDAHFVGTRTAELFGPDGSLWAGGELIDTVGLLEVEYLFALPVLVLVLVGAVAAYRVNASTGREGMHAGMGLVLGYFPLVLVGLLVSMHVGTGPSPLRAIVIAGIVYPVFFGAAGGFIAGHVGDAAPNIDNADITGDQTEVIR